MSFSLKTCYQKIKIICNLLGLIFEHIKGLFIIYNILLPHANKHLSLKGFCKMYIPFNERDILFQKLIMFINIFLLYNFKLLKTIIIYRKLNFLLLLLYFFLHFLMTTCIVDFLF